MSEHPRPAPEPGPVPDGPAGRERWIALAVCCSALFMTLLDVSVTNVALPSIADATGAGSSQLQWVVSGYTLSFGLVPVLAGRLGDDHGRRLMFQVGVGGFVVTSALSGLAPNAEVLIAARVLQGVAGGLINPQVSGLIQQMFSGRERGRAFGVLGTNVGLATALGPLVGGALIALGGPDLGWRLVFFVNVPVGIVVMLLSRRLLPVTPSTGSHRLDLLGSLTLGLATFSVLIAAIEYDAVGPLVLALAVPVLVLLGLFVRREARLTRTRKDPLIDLRLFRVPSYTSGVVLALLFFPAQAGLPLVMALYFQRGLGYTALQSALGVTAFALGSATSALLAGRVVHRVGRPLVVGAASTFAVGAVALALVARTGPTEHVGLLLFAPLFVMGAGSGGLITPNQALTLMEVDPVAGSTAGGVLQTAQRIGLAVGQAVIGATFLAAVAGPGASSYGTALTAAVAAALVFVAAAIGVGVLDLVRTRRRASS
ncbi:MFS transporter [Marmoricola endophyticus]|uniref:MFS transporter n=1 Tax=Marmoricola endophyticus TaxID=2040280 RepID=A0A917BJ21_9ACTN|nr:MFS transporter [Marmoricola endophyticus]GGF42350.1 MFS transporter [Marmoricola endophyticus]